MASTGDRHRSRSPKVPRRKSSMSGFVRTSVNVKHLTVVSADLRQSSQTPPRPQSPPNGAFRSSDLPKESTKLSPEDDSDSDLDKDAFAPVGDWDKLPLQNIQLQDLPRLPTPPPINSGNTSETGVSYVTALSNPSTYTSPMATRATTRSTTRPPSIATPLDVPVAPVVLNSHTTAQSSQSTPFGRQSPRSTPRPRSPRSQQGQQSQQEQQPSSQTNQQVRQPSPRSSTPTQAPKRSRTPIARVYTPYRPHSVRTTSNSSQTPAQRPYTPLSSSSTPPPRPRTGTGTPPQQEDPTWWRYLYAQAPEFVAQQRETRADEAPLVVTRGRRVQRRVKGAWADVLRVAGAGCLYVLSCCGRCSRYKREKGWG
ncbi:hypothetical protein BZA77DRAFT_306064 [Pyronema omphalodes]|nr:hypothetical protein BZA77DRAFT_306064 [Pyronema omphalodes]